MDNRTAMVEGIMFDLYQEGLIELIERSLPDVEVKKVSVTKQNDQMLHAIAIIKNGEQCGPNYYVDDLYEEAKYDMMEIMKKQVEEIVSNYEALDDIPQMSDFSWDNIKDRLLVRLMSKDLNRDYLENKIYRDIGANLVAVPEIVFKTEDYIGSAVMTKEMVEIPDEEVIDIAIGNALAKNPATLSPMENKIFGPFVNIIDEEELPKDMFVLSTQDERNGAAAMAYPKVLSELHRKIGDFYIIPSSVHEVLCLPKELAEGRDLLTMVREGNATVCMPHEVLADDVFLFDGELRSVREV